MLSKILHYFCVYIYSRHGFICCHVWIFTSANALNFTYLYILTPKTVIFTPSFPFSLFSLIGFLAPRSARSLAPEIYTIISSGSRYKKTPCWFLHPLTRIPNSSVRHKKCVRPSVTKKPGCRVPLFPTYRWYSEPK